MKKLSLLGLSAGLLAALSFSPAPAVADGHKMSTLEVVKKRGHLRCQVGQPSPGFYNLEADGTWVGSDVSVCRAVAAAIFGDPNKVEFQSVTSTVRFTALANGESDMLSRTATWTIFRDTQLGLNFTATNFYDGQGFIVRKDSGIKSAMELKGATVCVATGTTTELNLTDYSRMNKLDIQPVVFSDNNVRNESYLKGNCDAMTNDKSGLASSMAGFPDKSAHVILPETISKEPLAPAVRKGDDQWHDIVKWTVFALIGAEEMGITQANVDAMAQNPPNPEVARFLGVEKEMNKGLGLDKKWAHWIIKSVGNYGEIYEKYMGGGPKGIGIARKGSPNALWTRGGLMYSPPFR
ncbi:amino acid ABC transporter substrate-binding protein [Rhodospirillaceae bacterium]|jgi:general L-amino acid transport system substrate-binding protein|nr:amino acid ABC transporter substrate-binding protein [Rhodospirillaceae bacterium]MDC1442166.1 amino acid ABC transporter substrate-binding protein [Rhodospirillaceae bacterium]MDG1273413.1 amino acid ABC transporter substrate-binding protein [Alphaproteobacteria bacterium]MDG1887146.1 amino acid ABC transporter substrate-binding protein [Alphaproteobacteria bacterium]|tara:strand:+ start:3703 stop:4755 length:1053 start_codon:yes stop_codon:yes gene_type:complete